MPDSPALADEWRAAQSLVSHAQPIVIEHPKGEKSEKRFVPPQFFRKLRWLPESGGIVILRRFERDPSVLQVISSERPLRGETPHDRLVLADTSLNALKDWLGIVDHGGDRT